MMPVRNTWKRVMVSPPHGMVAAKSGCVSQDTQVSTRRSLISRKRAQRLAYWESLASHGCLAAEATANFYKMTGASTSQGWHGPSQRRHLYMQRSFCGEHTGI